MSVNQTIDNPPVTYYLDQYFFDIQDPRTKDYPLVNVAPWQIAPAFILYIITTKKLIPMWMKNREPLPIRKLILAYNIMMVAINAYFFTYFASKINYGLILLEYRYPPMDWSPATIQHIDMVYLYGCSKVADWFDTIFFALRKKQNHITFLHLYHHSFVPLIGWVMFKVNPMIPGLYLFGVMNCFVHSVMYSYYMLSSFGPAIQPYLWWKKYITQMQLIQFVILSCYAVGLAIFQTGYPVFWLFCGYTQPPFFLYMFYDFYMQAYRLRKSHKD